jgi:hypothetical protein
MTMTTSLATSERTEWPEFIGHWPRLKGRQFPEFESKFEGDEHQGDRCAEYGRRIGLRCMPWEWLTLRAILSLQPPDEWGDRLWTHRDATIECTRQQGKTLLIVLLILFHVFVLKTQRIVYTAQRWSTALDVFNRVWTVIDRVPSLKRRLAEKPTTGGNRGVIKLTNGAKIEFGPRSQDFGRGYTEVDLLIIDEAYDVDAGQEANLTGAQSAAANPQTIYVSTPPVADVHPKSQILAGLHRLGHKRAPDLYYAIYRAPETMARDDPAAWALAQPSYGVATNEREIRSKLQKAKTHDQQAIFNADYLGWGDYPPDESEIGSPIPNWADMRNPGAELVGQTALAIHRSHRDRRWVVAAAQATVDGRVHVELGRAWQATNTEVAEYVLAAVTSLNPVAVAIDQHSAAAVLKAELLTAGIEATMTNSAQLKLACQGVLDDGVDANLSHTGGQPLLDDAVESAAMRELTSGGFVWDDASIEMTAISLARWALLEFRTVEKKRPAAPAFQALKESETERSHGDSSELDVMSAAF